LSRDNIAQQVAPQIFRKNAPVNYSTTWSNATDMKDSSEKIQVKEFLMKKNSSTLSYGITDIGLEEYPLFKKLLHQKLPLFMQFCNASLSKHHPSASAVSGWGCYLKNPFFPFFAHVDIGTTSNICIEGSQQWYGFHCEKAVEIKNVSECCCCEFLIIFLDIEK